MALQSVDVRMHLWGYRAHEPEIPPNNYKYTEGGVDREERIHTRLLQRRRASTYSVLPRNHTSSTQSAQHLGLFSIFEL